MAIGASAVCLPIRESDEDVLHSVLPSARKIARFGFRIPPEDVDDVVQQAAVDFLVQLRRGGRASAGLFIVITRRRCLDYWRDRYRGAQEVALDSLVEGDPAYPFECPPDAQEVADGFRIAQSWPSLSLDCREVLARRFWNDQKTAELAAFQGRKPDTVKRMISRCLGRLRRSLGEAI